MAAWRRKWPTRVRLLFDLVRERDHLIRPSLQVRILQRAMNLLKHDGRIVYSTCSLNPVENEAVIAEALKLNPGTPKSLLSLTNPITCEISV